jgi:hypothetical protein
MDRLVPGPLGIDHGRRPTQLLEEIKKGHAYRPAAADHETFHRGLPAFPGRKRYGMKRWFLAARAPHFFRLGPTPKRL